MNKELSAAWERWQNFMQDQEEMRQTVERAMAWWMNKEKRAAWARWWERSRRRGLCVTRCSSSSTARRSRLQRWQEYVINKQEHEEMVAKAVSAFVKRAADGLEPLARVCEQQQAIRHAVSYFVNGTLIRALQTWQMRIVELNEERQMI